MSNVLVDSKFWSEPEAEAKTSPSCERDTTGALRGGQSDVECVLLKA